MNMDQEIIDYLEQRRSQLPRERRTERSQHLPSMNTRGLALSFLGITAVAGLIMMGVYHTPDLMRYLKIRSM